MRERKQFHLSSYLLLSSPAALWHPQLWKTYSKGAFPRPPSLGNKISHPPHCLATCDTDTNHLRFPVLSRHHPSVGGAAPKHFVVRREPASIIDQFYFLRHSLVVCVCVCVRACVCVFERRRERVRERESSDFVFVFLCVRACVCVCVCVCARGWVMKIYMQELLDTCGSRVAVDV